MSVKSCPTTSDYDDPEDALRYIREDMALLEFLALLCAHARSTGRDMSDLTEDVFEAIARLAQQNQGRAGDIDERLSASGRAGA